MADQSAGRVSLHPCFPLGLSTASTEITGEGGTPAFFLLPKRRKNHDNQNHSKEAWTGASLHAVFTNWFNVPVYCLVFVMV